MNYLRVFFLIFLLMGLSSCLKQGFEALNEYNYFAAKKEFERSLKRDESPAAYGLSVIYFRDDNPFSDVDSAYHYGLLAVESYNEATGKKHEKWEEKLSYSLETALAHRKLISENGYQEAIKENTVSVFNYFVSKYPWSSLIEEALLKRDSLAFLTAKSDGSSTALNYFLDKYADSKWVLEAQELLYQAEYDETVIPNDTKSLIKFIEQFPNNPFVQDAQYQIYILETKENTIPAFSNFLKNFPNSPFTDNVWIKLYRLSIAGYQQSDILNFKQKYPQFPFPEMIEQDLQLVGQELYQFIQNNKYGFMDEEGIVKIAPQFEFADKFTNGLSAVLKNNKYGFIDKKGNVKIDFQFDEVNDFQEGTAVVVKGDKYGLIDVTGNYILQPVYEDIGSFSEGLAYVQNENGYQYYTPDGSIAFSTTFDEAFSFENGIAKVRKGNKTEYISNDGISLISVQNGDLKKFTDTLFLYEGRDGMNLINSKDGSRLFEENMDNIGVLSENRAIVEKNRVYGYINSEGELMIPIKYVSFPNFLQFAEFKNGYAIHRQKDKFGMVDSMGTKVLPPIFSGIGKYGELIPITKGDSWGYTDESVQLKLPYQFDYAQEFVNGKAIVEKDGFFGMINTKGEEILALQFESILRLDNGLLMVKQQGKTGLLKDNGEIVIPPVYSRISDYSTTILQLVQNDSISYYDITKKQFITLKK